MVDGFAFARLAVKGMPATERSKRRDRKPRKILMEALGLPGGRTPCAADVRVPRALDPGVT